MRISKYNHSLKSTQLLVKLRLTYSAQNGVYSYIANHTGNVITTIKTAIT